MKLYKTTIVIWSEFNPDQQMIELSNLANLATNGNAYCSKQESEEVMDPVSDKDWDGTEFFGEMEEE